MGTTNKAAILFAELTNTKKEVIGALNSNGALSDRAMYLCEGCAQYGGKNMTANKKRKLTGTKHDIVSTYKFYNYVIDLFNLSILR